MVELYKRPGSAKWQAYLHDPRRPDSLHRWSTRTTNRKQALELARAKQAELDREIINSPKSHEIEGLRWIEAAERFLNGAKLQPSTKYGYASLAGIIARSTLGDFVLDALTHEDLKRFIRERRQSFITPHNKQGAQTKRKVDDPTIRRGLSFMSSVYRWHIDQAAEDAPMSNPVRTFDRSGVKENAPFDRHLRPLQFQDVLEACQDEQHKRIVIILLATGMRTSELLNLRWGEVDFATGYIEFGNLDPDRSKTKRARRIPITRYSFWSLLAQATAQFPGTKVKSMGYVFPSPIDGGRRYSLHWLLKAIKKRTGIKRFRIYDLRHTFASWSLQGGGDELAISKTMGHSTLTTTKRYAHHVSKSAAEKLRAVEFPISAQFTAQSVGSEEN